jgi:hypothetical protein
LLLATGVAACMLSALALLPALLRGVRLPASASRKLQLDSQEPSSPAVQAA